MAVGLFLAPAAIAENTLPEEYDAGDGSGFIALGVAALPEYEGASSYEPVPLIIGRLDAFNVRFEVEGLTARVNLRPRAGLQFGPTAGYRPGRNNVKNNVVDRLEKVNGAVEIGGFLRYQIDGVLRSGDELAFGAEMLADVSGAHEGLTANLGIGYALPFGERWRFGLDTGVTLASKNYMTSYFDIDAADAARSGLKVFDADGGLKDIGAGVTLGYNWSARWGVVGRAAYTRLVGDAADSPIVREEGTPNQFLAGLAVSFRF